jgi:microcystin-dependent protein
LSERVSGEQVGAETATLTVDQLPPHLHEFGTEATVEELGEVIDDLHEEGVLNQGQANALLAKLEQALASLADGQTAAACAKLQALVNQVEALVSAGVLTAAEGDELKELVEETMISIGC